VATAIGQPIVTTTIGPETTTDIVSHHEKEMVICTGISGTIGVTAVDLEVMNGAVEMTTGDHRDLETKGEVIGMSTVQLHLVETMVEIDNPRDERIGGNDLEDPHLLIIIPIFVVIGAEALRQIAVEIGVTEGGFPIEEVMVTEEVLPIEGAIATEEGLPIEGVMAIEGHIQIIVTKEISDRVGDVS